MKAQLQPRSVCGCAAVLLFVRRGSYPAGRDARLRLTVLKPGSLRERGVYVPPESEHATRREKSARRDGRSVPYIQRETRACRFVQLRPAVLRRNAQGRSGPSHLKQDRTKAS